MWISVLCERRNVSSREVPIYAYEHSCSKYSSLLKVNTERPDVATKGWTFFFWWKENCSLRAHPKQHNGRRYNAIFGKLSFSSIEAFFLRCPWTAPIQFVDDTEHSQAVAATCNPNCQAVPLCTGWAILMRGTRRWKEKVTLITLAWTPEPWRNVPP